jgi:hypothetical protein
MIDSGTFKENGAEHLSVLRPVASAEAVKTCYWMTRTLAALNCMVFVGAKYSARIATFCPVVRGLDVGLAPSKLVLIDVGGVPSVSSTV